MFLKFEVRHKTDKGYKIWMRNRQESGAVRILVLLMYLGKSHLQGLNVGDWGGCGELPRHSVGSTVLRIPRIW